MSLEIDPVVQIAARVLLTLLFLGTAVHKLRDLRTTSAITSRYLQGFGLPRSPVLAAFVTAVLIAAEFIAAGLCAVYSSGAAAAGVVAGLLGLYALGMAVSVAPRHRTRGLRLLVGRDGRAASGMGPGTEEFRVDRRGPAAGPAGNRATP